MRPWNPIHLDWKIEYLPSAGGPADWSLDEIDYVTQTTPGASGIVLCGRVHLTAGAASTAARASPHSVAASRGTTGTGPLAVRGPERAYSNLAFTMLNHLDGLTAVLEANPTTGAINRSPLDDIISALDDMDVLTGAMDNFHTRLRGGLTGDGLTVPQPPGSPIPSPFIPVRAGFLKIHRLRLVDGFGQFVDLAGSSDQQDVDPSQIITTGPAAVPEAPGIAALPPRFTSPARLWFRYLESTDDTQDATASTSPVCGYVLPNHLDGAVEFFDDQGSNLGEVRPDPQAGIVWDEAPGTPATVGTDPQRAIPNPKLAASPRRSSSGGSPTRWSRAREKTL